MNAQTPVNRTKEPIAMTGATKKRLQTVSNLFKGKEMFPEKLERAKQMFKGLQPSMALDI
jgi:hypothetical protein